MNKIKNENIKCIIRCFLNCLVFWIYYYLPYAFFRLLFSGTDLGIGAGGLIGLLHILVSLGLIIPVLSWRYAKKAIKCDKMRYFYCLCNAFVFVLPYIIALRNESEVFFAGLIFFAWVLLWEMIPMIQFEVKSHKERKEKALSDASQDAVVIDKT